MATSRRIDLPPAVTSALVGLGRFIGRHVAEGVKKTRASALKEIGAALKQAGDVVEAASNQEDEDRGELHVVDADFEPEPKKEVRRGRR
jgi:hypothetical protein